MSQKSVILRYQANSQSSSRPRLIEEVKAILKEKGLRVATLKLLPYTSAQTGVQFRVPEDFPNDDGHVFYFYYMANERNNKIDKIREYLSSSKFLKVFENSSFMIKGGKEEKKTPIDVTKGQKRTFEELELQSESFRVENLELKKKHFVAEKQLQVLTGTLQNYVDHHFGGNISLTTQQPFLLTQDAIALRGSCSHFLQRSDVENMNDNPFCTLCQNQEFVTFQEDWGLTSVSNGLFLSKLVQKNSEPLFLLNEMKETGKLHQVKQFDLIQNNDKKVMIPKIIYKETNSPSHSQLKEESLPVFPIDNNDPCSMDSSLLNSLLAMDQASFPDYLKRKETEIPGALNWEIREYCGYFTPPLPDPMSNEEIRDMQLARLETRLYHEIQQPLEDEIRILKQRIIQSPTNDKELHLSALQHKLERVEEAIAQEMARDFYVD